MNQLLTISMITKEALRVLENTLVVTKHVNRDYDDKFAVSGAKIGTTLNIRKPPRYLGREGQALQVEDSVETEVPLVLDTQFGVDIQFTSAELGLSIDDFSKRFIVPAIATVANKMDSDVCQLYKQIYNTVGTPGTTPTALLTYLSAGVKLNNNAAPRDRQRRIFLDPLMEATIVDALKGLFQQATAIAEQYAEGQMGRTSGFDWFMDQNIATHVYGTYAGTGRVNGANQTGSTLTLDGFTASSVSFNEGDTFTLDGVYMVNPQSRLTTRSLQDFVITAPATDDGAGNVVISISPAIVIAGAFQNVNAAPADNALINISGASGVLATQGLALHKDCITFASADLPLPRGVDMSGRVADPQLGVSIRMVRAYDINTDNFPMRLDVLYGMSVIRPEIGCRIQG